MASEFVFCYAELVEFSGLAEVGCFCFFPSSCTGKMLTGTLVILRRKPADHKTFISCEWTFSLTLIFVSMNFSIWNIIQLNLDSSVPVILSLLVGNSDHPQRPDIKHICDLRWETQKSLTHLCQYQSFREACILPKPIKVTRITHLSLFNYKTLKLIV